MKHGIVRGTIFLETSMREVDEGTRKIQEMKFELCLLFNFFSFLNTSYLLKTYLQFNTHT